AVGRARGLDALGGRRDGAGDARILAGRGARAAGVGGAAARSLRFASRPTGSCRVFGLAPVVARLAAGAAGALGIRGVGSGRGAADPARAPLVVVAGARGPLR